MAQNNLKSIDFALLLKSGKQSKHLIDAEEVQGGYFVVDTYANLTATGESAKYFIATNTEDGTIVEGSLCYCKEDGKYYQYKLKTNSTTEYEWKEVLKITDDRGNVNLGVDCDTGDNIGWSFTHGDSNQVLASHAYALGDATTASGYASWATGANTVASGHRSQAENYNTVASGANSHAEGSNTTASGEASHAEGWGLTSELSCTFESSSSNKIRLNSPSTELLLRVRSGIYVSLDYMDGRKQVTKVLVAPNSDNYELTISDTVLSGSGSFFIKTVATSNGAHAEGQSTIAAGHASHAEGFNAEALDNFTHAEGYKTTAYGEASHAEGWETETSDHGAHAEGAYTAAVYRSAHAEGEYTRAEGQASHAEGYNTRAIGKGSHAEGGNENPGGKGTVKTVTVGSTEYTVGGDYGSTAVGSQSHAEGAYTLAGGLASHAEGLGTVATGDGSHAEGQGATASGGGSHAEGSGQATKYCSHAEGIGTTASGDGSHAEGNATTASAGGSHAEGYSTQATLSAAHAEGHSSVASGAAAHAEGQETKAMGTAAHAEGGILSFSNEYLGEKTATLRNGGSYVYKGSTAVGTAAHAEGTQTLAYEHSSHTEGYQTRTENQAAHAEGNNTLAAGAAAHAEGYNTLAVGNYSHAEGTNTQATQQSAHAEGIQTLASGISAHSEGYTTTASGYYSHAEGFGEAISLYSPSVYEDSSNNAISLDLHTNNNGNIYSRVDVGDLLEYTTSDGTRVYAPIIKAIYADYVGIFNIQISNSVPGFPKTTPSNATSAYRVIKGVAYSMDAHAEGYNTTAFGSHSHSEGANTRAIANYSHAGGIWTVANAVGQTVVGTANKLNPEALFIVGNGNQAENGTILTSSPVHYSSRGSDLRSNALEVLKDGRVNTSGKVYAEGLELLSLERLKDHSVNLSVTSTLTDLSSGTSTIIGRVAGQTLQVKVPVIWNYVNAQTMAVKCSGSTAAGSTTQRFKLEYTYNGNTSTKFSITEAGNVTAAGQVQASSFYATSDLRLKENIKEFKSKKSILDLPVVEFDFKDSGEHQIGCLAQDLQEICPELVKENEKGYLSINESKLVYLLIDEVKKLKQEVAELRGN